MSIIIPRTVPARYHQEFVERLSRIAPYHGKALIFAADHKLEQGLTLDPTHFFAIAEQSKLVLASHLGLISRYLAGETTGAIIKLSAKTPTQKLRNAEPNSIQITSIEEVVTFNKNNHNKVLGVGITIYLGSEKEEIMLANAARAITQAHEHGFPVVLWSYVRGSAIAPEKASSYLPLTASVGASLGADFVKLQLPQGDLSHKVQLLEETKVAAGNVQLLFAGGEPLNAHELLRTTNYLVHQLGWAGGAIGRNIFGHPTNYACLLAQTVTKLMASEIDLDDALAQIP